MLSFVDTHCHIHEAGYPEPEDALRRAHEAGVAELICVGTNHQSSKEALSFAARHDQVFAAIGVHPHDTKEGYEEIASLAQSAGPELVAIGEIGLDYFYGHSSREVQLQALRAQLQVAVDHDLPVIFHVRDGAGEDSAFADFWPLIDGFHYRDGSMIRGELHSFTDNYENLVKGLERGFYVGINGISTFTKDSAQQAMFAAIPLERMLLETDAPFLTPTPYRGTVNEPAFVRTIAEYYVEHYRPHEGISIVDIAQHTTTNAHDLFGIS